MQTAGPNPVSDPHAKQHAQRTRILSAEATGLLIIAIVVLIVTLIRYWHQIPWSAR